MAIELDASEARAVRFALKSPGLTRADLAEVLGASAPTATALAKRLVNSGVLVEDGATASTGGRPAAKLYVSRSIGYCCSHQVIRGRLTSCALDPSGGILGTVDRPIADVASMLRGVSAAELELSVKAPNLTLITSGIVVPGIVDRRSNTGEAPWLFGKELIDPSGVAPHSFLVSAASSLTSKQEASTSIGSSGPWLALDLADSLSGLFLTRGGTPVPLDLAHLEPNPAIILAESLDDAVRRAAESRSSRLGAKLKQSTPQDALSSAHHENDSVACSLVDRLVAETLAFIRNVARTLRPQKLILSSNLLDPKLGLADTMLNGIVRHAGMPRDEIVLIPPADVIEHRFVGASGAALNLMLGNVERANGTLKVE